MIGHLDINRFSSDIRLRVSSTRGITQLIRKSHKVVAGICGLPKPRSVLFGSIPRKTAIALSGKSDGDVLLQFPLSALSAEFVAKPHSLVDTLSDTFRSAGLSTIVYTNCITISHGEATVDVVPAIGTSREDLCIPHNDGERWSVSNPLAANRIFASATLRSSGAIVELARLVKAWNMAHGRLLQSYHIDCMALDHVGMEKRWIDTWDLIWSFWREFASALQAPTFEPATQARIDTYLDTHQASFRRTRAIRAARTSMPLIGELFASERRKQPIDFRIVSGIWGDEVSRYFRSHR